MKIINLEEIDPGSKPAEVFYEGNNFNSRLISLKKGEEIPPCDMDSNLIFTIIEGEVEISVNEQKNILSQNQVLIADPGLFSMEALKDSKIMGIQIAAN